MKEFKLEKKKGCFTNMKLFGKMKTLEFTVNPNQMGINWIGIFALHGVKNQWRESFSQIRMCKSNIKMLGWKIEVIS